MLPTLQTRQHNCEADCLATTIIIVGRPSLSLQGNKYCLPLQTTKMNGAYLWLRDWVRDVVLQCWVAPTVSSEGEGESEESSCSTDRAQQLSVTMVMVVW